MASTISVLLAKPPGEMNLLDRLLNIFAHYFFKIFIDHLSIAKFFVGKRNPELFKPQDNTLLFANIHKFIDWPTAKTHGLIEIGNFDDKIEDKELDQVKIL